MEKKHTEGLLEHIDFILLDILCLQVSFVFSYWINIGFFKNPYHSNAYQFQAIVLAMSQLLVILFSDPYQNVLKRKQFDETVAVIKSMAETLMIALVFMFVIHRSYVASRLQFGFTSVIYVVLSSLMHSLNKYRILKSRASERNKRSIVVITSGRLVETAIAKLRLNDPYCDYFVSYIVLIDGACDDNLQKYSEQSGIPILSQGNEDITRISHDWVDEAFILQPENIPFPVKLMEKLVQMGVTVNYSAEALTDERWSFGDVRRLGEYRVLTGSTGFVSNGQLAVKRLMDIIGGAIGCVITGILFLFIAPAIYNKSPGPIFFAQERVGKNGKIFKMYKFRSMYLDAEERKASLMAENKITDGMMFKMDDDPRIIGSEKKDKNGKPKGIGNFIRNTSLDEFPQFFNVLKGNMSLVGTRPPTLDEWNQYDLGHRIRMSIKPGITGLWQISGRSEITDFSEVVRLDREYIEDWSILLDIKILLKTVAVVVMRKGAK